jgi:hypothetical protein
MAQRILLGTGTLDGGVNMLANDVALRTHRRRAFLHVPEVTAGLEIHGAPACASEEIVGPEKDVVTRQRWRGGAGLQHP